MSSLFGASPAQQAGGTTGTFSFGNNNTSSSSQPPPQQQQQQQQQPCASGGFSFGQTPAMQQPSQQTQPANAFGFGQPSQQNNSATAGGSGGLFGANTGKQLQEASTPASSFGSGGLFAASTAEQPKPAFPFGFVPSGQQIQQPQQTSLGQSQFGQSQPQFGQSQLGGSQMGASSSQSQPQHDKKLGTSLSAKLEQVRQAWDTSNLHTCNFLVRLPPSVSESPSAYCRLLILRKSLIPSVRPISTTTSRLVCCRQQVRQELVVEAYLK